MSRSTKKEHGHRVGLYLTEELTEQGLVWINKQLKRRKLNSTLLHLINKEAEQELQSLDERVVTSAQNNNTGQSNEVLNLIAQLIQNGQLGLNTGQHTQSTTKIDSQNISQHHQEEQTEPSDKKQVTEEDTSKNNAPTDDNKRNENDLYINNGEQDKTLNNNKVEKIEPPKLMGNNELTNDEVACTIESPSDIQSNSNPTSGVRVGRRRSLHGYNGQMTNGIK